ncbi:hypothetical protein [Halomicrobium salinisoli]|uniref:hypothetical protein n=1 Tax=Halomicrobium salinisoli TaxID=2878391 RepID=UPI001CF0D355|nr:hypothetical protein [Halomicrobium salinisoli]
MSVADRMRRAGASIRKLGGRLPSRSTTSGPVHWFLLSGNRHAVTAALFTVMFGSILVVGTVWSFEMQQVLTETESVQTILNTLLSGIILLVSIVVSINSVVLSYDLASIGQQRERIEKAVRFRYDLGDYADPGSKPTNPGIFLDAILAAVDESASDLQSALEDAPDDDLYRETASFAAEVQESVTQFNERHDRDDADELEVLWAGLEFDYTAHMDRSQDLQVRYAESGDDEIASRLDALVELFELFATGKEYFKTLYYSREFSTLSRTLISVSLPAIVVNATSILAIDAGLLPDVWLLGLPPLLTFVATTFAVSLLPFLVLTSFTLRAATVARKTVAAGPFVLEA